MTPDQLASLVRSQNMRWLDPHSGTLPAGDRLIRVFTDRAPVRMSTVICPGCGHGLDVICEGFQRIPPNHSSRGQGSRNANGAPVSWPCPVESDDLATLVAQAQVACAEARAAAAELVNGAPR